MNSNLKKIYLWFRQWVRALALLGLPGLWLMVRSFLGSHAEQVVHVDGAELLVRLNTTDLATLLHVFGERDYDLEFKHEPQSVIDAGANVGYSAVYFARRFPQATIVALEPEAENFRQLERHAARYPQIKPVQAALWTHATQLTLQDAGAGAWGFRVGPQGGGTVVATVAALGIDDLAEQFSLDRIGLLKMDIEGSEVEVFNASSSWIDRVDCIVAELHDKYRTGCARAFYRATGDFPIEYRRGENIFLQRETAS